MSMGKTEILRSPKLTHHHAAVAANEGVRATVVVQVGLDGDLNSGVIFWRGLSHARHQES